VFDAVFDAVSDKVDAVSDKVIARVPDHLPRRRLLIASATALPLLLVTSGCRSADLFAGPDPLGGRPPLAHDTVVLEAAITAETGLIARYQSVISAHGASAGLNAGESALLADLLAQHQGHLARLRGRLIVPAGTSPAPAAPSPEAKATATATPAPSPGATAKPHPMSALRDAEQESADSLVRQLAGTGPALAQLFASIAASDATHAAALSAFGSS
jgi:hypothetical protein